MPSQMSSVEDLDQTTGHSRRNFLAKLSLGLIGLASAGYFLRSILPLGGKSGPGQGGEFPGEESIFHPRKDPRLEAQERRRET